LLAFLRSEAIISALENIVMPRIHVRNISEESYAGFRAYAQKNGRSISAQFRLMLDELAEARREKIGSETASPPQFESHENLS
jgi:hypothetical protein